MWQGGEFLTDYKVLCVYCYLHRKMRLRVSAVYYVKEGPKASKVVTNDDYIIGEKLLAMIL